MKILFDTNVVLDLLLNRTPFIKEAEQLFSYVESEKIIGILSATTLTTIHYLAAKNMDTKQTHKIIANLLQLFEIAPVNRMVLESANQVSFSDFEDAVLHEAGRHIGAHAIITRNTSDFKKASLAIYTPKEFLQHIHNF